MRLALSAVLACVACVACAATAQSFDARPYAENVRGWQVDALSDDQGFIGCAGMTEQGDGFLGVMKTRDGWMLRVPTRRTASWDGAVVSIDGTDIDAQAEFFAEGAGHIGIADQAVGMIGNGSKLKVAINDDDTTRWTLTGSAAMIGKVKECYSRLGAKVRDTKPPPVVAVESDARRKGKDCPRVGKVTSGEGLTPAKVRFRNKTDVAITLYWLDQTGTPVEYDGMLPGEEVVMTTWAEHRWLARDFNGTCHGGVIYLSPGKQVWEIF